MSDSMQGPHRRSVLKGAAWTTPAIVLATAAPAMAASGPASVAQSAVGVVDRPNLKMTTTVSFSNANTGAAPATVEVRVAASAGGISADDPTGVTGGWSFTGATPVGSAAIRTFTFMGTIPGAATATSTQASSLGFTVGVTTAVGGLVSGNLRVTTVVTSPATVTPNPAVGAWG